MKIVFFTTMLFLVLLGCAPNESSVGVSFPETEPYSYLAKSFTASLEEAGYQIESSAEYTIEFILDNKLDPESYQVVSDGSEITILGPDLNGLMYGSQYITQQLSENKTFSEIESTQQYPEVAFRAIKFNLPWDSYRRSPALQMHFDVVRDINYWEVFLNMMAENRFNTLTLWNLHPFNWMIRPKNFPEACAFDDQELADWQQFWTKLFAMAKKRGIETYIVNWNIFVSAELAEARNVAKYSIGETYFTEGDTSELVKKYNKECVTQVLNEYPDLTGIGISLGEGMGGMTPTEREVWAIESLIAGIQEADRPAKLIHRVPFSANKGSGGSTDLATEQMTRNTLDSLAGNIQNPVWVEIKFNWSHGHSSPQLVKVHGGAIDDTYWNPQPDNYRIAWMIRNEDFFCLRWGQPDFIRKHIALNNKEYAGGYFIGSECYIPAVDYFTKSDELLDWKYAFERQHLYYKMWGRLLYNPDTENQVFINHLTRKYGEVGTKLFEAYQLASRTPLQIASFWNATWDFTLYSEGFMALKEGKVDLISVDHLIDVDPLDSDFLSVKEFLQADVEIENKISPLDLADSLDNQANQALEVVSSISFTDNPSLNYEVADVKIWSHLAHYFAQKLRAAVDLAAFRESNDQSRKESSLSHLQESLNHWKALVEVSEPLYNVMPLVHLSREEDEYFHWSKMTEKVENEINQLKKQGFVP